MEDVVHGSLPWNDGSESFSSSPYKDLAAGIVLQAVKDYIKAIRRMWDPNISRQKKRDTILEKLELEKFFRSDWYEELCDINPEELIRNCHLRAEEQEKEDISRENKRKRKQLLREAPGKGGLLQ